MSGQALRETLKEKKDYVEFIVSLEGEWLLKEELFGKGSEEVQDHVEEMILEFNSIATRLISVFLDRSNFHQMPPNAGYADNT